MWLIVIFYFSEVQSSPPLIQAITLWFSNLSLDDNYLQGSKRRVLGSPPRDSDSMGLYGTMNVSLKPEPQGVVLQAVGVHKWRDTLINAFVVFLKYGGGVCLLFACFSSFLHPTTFSKLFPHLVQQSFLNVR